MKRKRILLGFVLCILVGSVAGAAVVFGRGPGEAARDDPWAHVSRGADPVDHSKFFADPFPDGPAVTRACLECHPDSGREVMKTSHWNWAAQRFKGPDGRSDVHAGKRNLINNFCIAVAGNWPRCTSCHAGYGWKDETFDFSLEENVDCLVCHDTTGTYFKDPAGAGAPAKTVDLLAVARKVGRPSRRNCGLCHFNGGGGDAVKHGDMDGSMNFPTARIDVHMGKHDFTCQDCHRTVQHEIPGAAMSLSTEKLLRVKCTDCHAAEPHVDSRLNAHTHAVACQACHVPTMAIDVPTKTSWDWSQAGKTTAELKRDNPKLFQEFLAAWNPPASLRSAPEFGEVSLRKFKHYLVENGLYSKKKGLFTFARRVEPEYYWYNGRSVRYLTGETIDPSRPVVISRPLGSVKDPKAQIYPFKVHRGKQPYDVKHRILLTPKVYGPGGYWSDFDWDRAFRLGAAAARLPYSGEYAFVASEMWWPLSHMVAEKDRSLGCRDCHGREGRMDWSALGYDGDPAYEGTRLLTKMPVECERKREED